jgi:hypothetical protein
MKNEIVRVCKDCKSKFLSDGSESYCGCMTSEERSWARFHEEAEEQEQNRREYIAERKLTTDTSG